MLHQLIFLYLAKLEELLDLWRIIKQFFRSKQKASYPEKLKIWSGNGLLTQNSVDERYAQVEDFFVHTLEVISAADFDEPVDEFVSILVGDFHLNLKNVRPCFY